MFGLVRGTKSKDCQDRDVVKKAQSRLMNNFETNAMPLHAFVVD